MAHVSQHYSYFATLPSNQGNCMSHNRRCKLICCFCFRIKVQEKGSFLLVTRDLYTYNMPLDFKVLSCVYVTIVVMQVRYFNAIICFRCHVIVLCRDGTVTLWKVTQQIVGFQFSNNTLM